MTNNWQISKGIQCSIQGNSNLVSLSQHSTVTLMKNVPYYNCVYIILNAMHQYIEALFQRKSFF